MTIQIGYGSDRRGKNPKNCYGSRSTGKVLHNGGFNFQPTITFGEISDERWNEIFPKTPKLQVEIKDEPKMMDLTNKSVFPHGLLG